MQDKLDELFTTSDINDILENEANELGVTLSKESVRTETDKKLDSDIKMTTIGVSSSKKACT